MGLTNEEIQVGGVISMDMFVLILRRDFKILFVLTQMKIVANLVSIILC